jgi:hypothetical protein
MSKYKSAFIQSPSFHSRLGRHSITSIAKDVGLAGMHHLGDKIAFEAIDKVQKNVKNVFQNVRIKSPNGNYKFGNIENPNSLDSQKSHVSFKENHSTASNSTGNIDSKIYRTTFISVDRHISQFIKNPQIVQ